MPSYDVCSGVRTDTLELDFSPSGLATATFGLIGQGSSRTGASSGGTSTSAAYTAFNKAQGSIDRSGSALAQVTGAKLTFTNPVAMVRTIRADRKIEGPAGVEATFDFRAAYSATAITMMTVALKNQQGATDYA